MNLKFPGSEIDKKTVEENLNEYLAYLGVNDLEEIREMKSIDIYRRLKEKYGEDSLPIIYYLFASLE